MNFRMEKVILNMEVGEEEDFGGIAFYAFWPSISTYQVVLL